MSPPIAPSLPQPHLTHQDLCSSHHIYTLATPSLLSSHLYHCHEHWLPSFHPASISLNANFFQEVPSGSSPARRLGEFRCSYTTLLYPQILAQRGIEDTTDQNIFYSWYSKINTQILLEILKNDIWKYCVFQTALSFLNQSWITFVFHKLKVNTINQCFYLFMTSTTVALISPSSSWITATSHISGLYTFIIHLDTAVRVIFLTHK